MKKITLSIGIAAYNEQANIAWMLKSVLSQKEESYLLSEILIYSDGSNDKTVDIAKSFGDKRIKVIDSPSRLGKPTRLNQIFKKFNGDYLLLTDADVKFDGQYVIEKMVNEIVKDPELGLIMAKVYPYKGETLLENAIFNFFEARDSVKNGYDYRKTVYAARGAGMMLSKSFAKSLTIPTSILNDDAYIYLSARARNLKVSFARGAMILYKLVNNVRDYRTQFKRYLDGEKQFAPYFKKELLDKEYRAPTKLLLRIMFKQIRANFLAYALLRLINSYCHLSLKFKNRESQIKWTVAVSSKTLVLSQILEKTEGSPMP